ncbi:MAG TPA: GTPase HflX, partial [Terriglobia bacterium]|nr:GTPase HflX [Terriglobia bacterium]
VLISDTVGFIRKLPHQLVSAFRATLEEVVEADLILHVIDASDPDRLDKRRVVLDVLDEIGAGDHPRFTVYNKSDLVDPGDAAPILQPNEFFVSAVTGQNLTELVSAIVAEVSMGK